MEITITRLTSANAAVLNNIAIDVFDDDINHDRVAEYLAESGHIMVIALAGDLVVGQVSAIVIRHPDADADLYIDNVGVSPSWLRQGIGRQMLDKTFSIGRSMGCAVAWVGTEHDNVPARGLYESKGSTGESFVIYEYEL